MSVRTVDNFSYFMISSWQSCLSKRCKKPCYVIIMLYNMKHTALHALFLKYIRQKSPYEGGARWHKSSIARLTNHHESEAVRYFWMSRKQWSHMKENSPVCMW